MAVGFPVHLCISPKSLETHHETSAAGGREPARRMTAPVAMRDWCDTQPKAGGVGEPALESDMAAGAAIVGEHCDGATVPAGMDHHTPCPERQRAHCQALRPLLRIQISCTLRAASIA